MKNKNQYKEINFCSLLLQGQVYPCKSRGRNGVGKICKLISFLFLISILILPLLFHGCSSSVVVYSDLNKEKGLFEIKRVGVLPFVNESEKRQAGEIVTNTFNTILFKSDIFQIEEKGNIEKFLISEKVKSVQMMDMEQLKKLGMRLKIDAVFIGVVEEFTGGDWGGRLTTPVVVIRVKLIDIRSGKVLWMVRHKKSGDDYITVFGFGRVRSISALTKKVVSEIIETIR